MTSWVGVTVGAGNTGCSGQIAAVMSGAVIVPLSRLSRAPLAGPNMLSLKRLGGASLERAGVPSVGRAGRVHRIALLAVLALVGGRPLSRDKLLTLLWPEFDTDRARRSLSDTLYLLRAAFGDEVVTAVGDDLRRRVRAAP